MSKGLVSGKRRAQRVGGVVSQTVGHVTGDQVWSPAINMYQMAASVVVCVDLAGVDRKRLCVSVERGCLCVSGQRAAPDPVSAELESIGGETVMNKAKLKDGREIRIVRMEIDYGPFSERIRIPSDIDLDRVGSVYREGLLWIHLPVK
ncbi:Hsp20/alpha crystallin family protein [Poriferisphaera sp. WC338]|uniref:Hsp20/alpha crystallin family protein n=1 Tax=Poriferisphaera sp. WC338 TaxID=3425129 RepID=UPI003D812D18